MASPQKRLGEFLNEQQEPFMLELYLLEKGYLNEDSVKKRKTKVLLPFSKFLASIVNKLAFHSQCNNTLETSRDNGQRKKHASCNVQISSASSNYTMFNSCSNADEEGTSISSHKDQNLLNEDFEEMPKKITEDSLLSAAMLNLLGVSIKKEDGSNQLQEYIPEPHVSQVLKSKRVSHKIKKLLFDCVKDITLTLPTKEASIRKQVCRKSMRPIEFEKLTCQGTREWRQYSEDGLMSLFNIDSLDSIMEWSKFEQQVKAISFEISDATLDIIINEIVLEVIGT